MISKVNKIKNFGIFEDFKWKTDLLSFNKYNLFYGWNGSGKTTLSKIFRNIENGKNTSSFLNAEFELEIDSGTKITHSSTENYPLIRVFNQDFVTANLNLFNATTNPILFISEEKVEEKIQLEAAKAKLQILNEQLSKSKENQKQLENDVEDCFKESGKAIKDFLLGTSYANVNHNKGHAKSIWSRIKISGHSLNEFIRADDELTRLKVYTLINSRKEKIQNSLLTNKFDIEKLNAVAEAVKELWQRKLTSTFIERLKQNPDINNWVAKGLEIHKTHNSLKCEFCNQQLTESKLSELENHFSKAYTQLQYDLEAKIASLKSGLKNEITDLSQYLYEEVQESYLTNLNAANEQLNNANEVIKGWISLLIKKQQDPFKSDGMYFFDPQPFLLFNEFITDLNLNVTRHNEISEGHLQLSEDAKTQIENHFVAQKAIEKNLNGLEGRIILLKKEIETFIAEQNIENESIKSLENELKNDSIAIEEINSNLHKFLGRNNIVLNRIPDGGYQLLRNRQIATNLSEGEKTAISLVYFISKIKENDLKIHESIIVFDDPISSFDSNHLFSAATFVINNCKDAKQLFVLTHNFWFFKQVRDWMKDKNKKLKDGTESIKSHYYAIKEGEILNADKTLVHPHSEYHFLFSTILKFKNSGSIGIEESYSIANVIRRLLEAFSSFKTASNAGFNAVLLLGLNKGLNPHQKDRIYYFLHKYSHLDRIESFDNTIEPLFEEGKNVVNDVLDLIKTLDEDHFNSMLKACSSK